jgi:hypothetical protein
VGSSLLEGSAEDVLVQVDSVLAGHNLYDTE